MNLRYAYLHFMGFSRDVIRHPLRASRQVAGQLWEHFERGAKIGSKNAREFDEI